jgi:hypothetical protein
VCGPSKSRPARASTRCGVGDVMSVLGPRRWRGIAAHGRFRKPKVREKPFSTFGTSPKGTESAFRGDGLDDEARASVAGAAPERSTSGGAGRRAGRRTPKPRSPLVPWPAPAASSGVRRGLFRARGVESRQRNLAKRESPCQGSLRCAWMFPGSTPPQEWVRERLVPQANWARGGPPPPLDRGMAPRIRAV